MSNVTFNDEMRSKLIDKILDIHETEELFNILKLDIHDVIEAKLKTLNDEQILNIITDGEL